MSKYDNFRYRKDSYLDSFAITPHDTNDLTDPSQALLVVATGNLSIELVKGGTVALTAVAANTILPLACKKVLSTGTTATVVGLQ